MKKISTLFIISVIVIANSYALSNTTDTTLFSGVGTSFNEETVSFAFDDKEDIQYVNNAAKSKAKDNQKRFAIKTNILGSVITYFIYNLYPIQLTAEMALRQFSVALTGFYGVGNPDITWYQVGTEGRYYFSEEQLKGFYLGVGTGYEYLSMRFNILGTELELDAGLYYGNAKVGYQLPLGYFVMDFFGGYQYSHIITTIADSTGFNPHSFSLGTSFGAIF